MILSLTSIPLVTITFAPYHHHPCSIIFFFLFFYLEYTNDTMTMIVLLFTFYNV